MTDWLTAFLAWGGVWVTGYGIGYRHAWGKAKRDRRYARDKSRFDEIYAPLYGLFLEESISICEGVGAPRLKHRVRLACSALHEGRPWLFVFAQLFEKHKSRGAGYDNGGYFPLTQINQRVSSREKYADKELLIQIARANRAAREGAGDENMLTEEELELYDHIVSEYLKLHKRLK